MTTQTFHLTIKYKVFTKRERKYARYGYIERKSANRYVIWINRGESLLETIGTLYHEISHFVFYTLFKDAVIPDAKEHEFCEDMDEAAKENFKKVIGFVAEEEEDE